MKRLEQQKEEYASPRVEVIEMWIESGFAATASPAAGNVGDFTTGAAW